jgi:hypothetical protein
VTSSPASSLATTGPAPTADGGRAVTGDVWKACLGSAGDPLERGTREPPEQEVVLAQIRIVVDEPVSEHGRVDLGRATRPVRVRS